MTSTRDRFSINIDEDYELYGIDPNVDLDDWSFLDAKPEPIPEKTEEEKRLFEQLLAPSIPEEEIQHEIHDRLKSLIAETTEFIKNDVKVELSAPIEIPEVKEKPQVDKNSFEHKQAARMSAMMKKLVTSTQKAEEITDFIKTITKSDKMERKMEKEAGIILKHRHHHKHRHREQKDEKDMTEEEKKKEEERRKRKEEKRKRREEEKKRQEEEERKKKEEEKKRQEEAKKEPMKFLSRYQREPGAVKTVIRDLDETERLNSKFKLERKKREEEAEKEAERQRKEMEERQQKFFADLELEAEKHRRELQMEEEIKNSKAPTMSDMLKQIQSPKAEAAPVVKPKAKPKEDKPPPRASAQQIAAFMAEREKKIKPRDPRPLLVVELETNKEDTTKVGSHYSNTFKKNVQEALAKKLTPVLKRWKKRKVKFAWKVLIFMRFARQLAAAKARKRQEKKRRRRACHKAKKTFSAIKIQRAWRRFWAKQQVKRKAQMAEVNAKADQNQLEKVRKLLNDQITTSPQQKPAPRRRQQRDYNFPNVQDPDTTWMKAQPDAMQLFDDFLDGLPDKKRENPVLGINGEKITGPFQAESQSIPLTDDIDDYLAKFNQRIVLPDEPDEAGSTPKAPAKQAPKEVKPPPEPQDDVIRKAREEGYNFKDPTTIERMEKMRQRRFGKQEPKDERPLERFNRIYGNQRSSPQRSSGSNQPSHVVQHVHRSEFKHNDERTRRLQKLKKAWLSGPPEGAEDS